MRSLCYLLLITILSMALGSCASFSRNAGKAYQTGTASWYGEKFHGRLTASGERYDMNALTAAHRTLPFGQKILITSLTTGRSVSVRVNDRGPFHSDRILDVSYAAAKELNLLSKGQDRVQIHLLE